MHHTLVPYISVLYRAIFNPVKKIYAYARQFFGEVFDQIKKKINHWGRIIPILKA